MMARTWQEGTFMNESLPIISYKNRLRVAKGVVKILKNGPLHILVVKTKIVSVPLPKNMNVAQFTEAALTIVVVHKISGVDSIMQCPFVKEVKIRSAIFQISECDDGRQR